MDVLAIIGIYLLCINIISFAAMGIDKRRAIRRAWRIPELTLFILAIAGGSLGAFCGMHLFHHKTKHWYFLYGLPLILGIHVIFLAYVTGAKDIVLM